MPSKTWGTPLTINQYITVGDQQEIPKGQHAYVFNHQTSEVEAVQVPKWNDLRNGDLALIRQQIEAQIPHVTVEWIKVSWDSAEYKSTTGYREGVGKEWYDVKGFHVEAIVKNEGAALTGAEIVLIIMVIGFIAAVIWVIAMGSWVTWQIMDATKAIGPVATVGVGLLILFMLLIFLFLMFGGKVRYGKAMIGSS